MKSIILYGGNFDPIHQGHLRIALEASKRFDADVFFIPNKCPPWKNAQASTKDRLAMLQLAIKETNNPRLHISTYEIEDTEREVSLSYYTVSHFVEAYPEAKLYLLIGGDQCNAFDKWFKAEEIASMLQIVVCSRPDYPLSQQMVERFHMISLGYEESGEVSSTKVRTLHSGDYPISIRDYIEAHELYYIKALKEYLTPKRLSHCVQVARLCYEIALTNHIERPYRAYVAGLLHDLAKNMEEGEGLRMMKEHFPSFASLPSWTHHQFLGRLLAQKDFGIEDESILNAIACHATGKGDMSPLEMILYAADKIEPTRGYDSSDYIASCLKDYEQGFRIVLQANREYYQEKGYDFLDNILTQACVKQYLGD